MKFLLLTTQQAATVRGETENLAALDPRQIAAGPKAGQFVLPTAVLTDDSHKEWHNYLVAMPTIDIDPAVAWPSTDP